MKAKLITVTGYFGAPIVETARKIAGERNLPLVILDDEIKKSDGRSIKRLVMMNGEHGYRNKEYEILQELAKTGCAGPEPLPGSDTPPAPCRQNKVSLAKAPQGIVISCGDGVLHDGDSREIIARGELVIAGRDMTPDSLWENAKKISDTYHAFMSFGTDVEKREAFDKLLQRQRTLFSEFTK